MSEPPPAELAGRGEQVLEALASTPGGPQLLALSERCEDVALVGGSVRDLLLHRTPRELDVVLAHHPAAFAQELAQALGARLTTHERFGTALLQWEGGRIDLARQRAETYPAPGALPEVRPGTVEEDLARRDFTVNAIAVAIGGERPGTLRVVEHAGEDLAAGRLRVLHERSFIDDPTRLWRLARYQARLGFQPEQHTAELAAAAVAGGALATVSPARIGAELRLALGESISDDDASPKEKADAPASLLAADALGLLRALHPALHLHASLAHAALDLLAAAAGASIFDDDASPKVERKGARPLRPDLLVLAALLAPALAEDAGERELYELLNELEFTAADRDTALHAALSAPAAAARLAGAHTPSQIYEAAAHMSPEGVALAGAWGEVYDGRPKAAEAAREWLTRLYGVTLLITGEDLLAAGIPQGPEIRRRLDAALLRKLDGELPGDGREAELSAALGATR